MGNNYCNHKWEWTATFGKGKSKEQEFNCSYCGKDKYYPRIPRKLKKKESE